jgi:hypothetical protein
VAGAAEAAEAPASVDAAGVAALVVPVGAAGLGETDDVLHADAIIPTARSIPSRLVHERSLI